MVHNEVNIDVPKTSINEIVVQDVVVRHRLVSLQGPDYTANYFFLNLRVSRTKIENQK